MISEGRPWGGEMSDVRIADGTIAEVLPHDPARTPEQVVAGRGRLLLPSFSDVHVHLDSTRIGLPFRPHTGGPGVWAMMLNDRAHWRDGEVGITERVADTLARMIARGTTRVRSFAQVDVDCRLERLEAVLAARETHRDRADVQVIAFPQAGLLREDGSPQVLEDALRAGADVVGGIDPCTLDRDPVRHLDIVFGLAERYQLPVDVHLHEPGELGRFSADLIIERTRALGMQGRVLISHGYGMWDGTESQVSNLVQAFAEADIATATIAPGGGRGIPLRALSEAGVRVGLGEDGQRDYWSPYGNADMLDRTWQLGFTSGFRADELIEHCLAVATVGGAGIMDPSIPRLSSLGDRPGLAVGDPAHLTLVDGESVTSAVMDRPADRTVIHAGQVVADQLQLT
ncbi:MAG: amidohydrolase family protein [Ornithinimicrobium sp.]|uniref:amidohydrolase family protein n=1 Tax=Ornithinimicrobium sp. TaxID=1977084 RepID=UPI003D9BB0E5